MSGLPGAETARLLAMMRFLCSCLRARSRLYIGPNLLRPPRILSGLTAVEIERKNPKSISRTVYKNNQRKFLHNISQQAILRYGGPNNTVDLCIHPNRTVQFFLHWPPYLKKDILWSILVYNKIAGTGQLFHITGKQRNKKKKMIFGTSECTLFKDNILIAILFIMRVAF